MTACAACHRSVAVETPRHEVPASVLLEQPALAHRDSAGMRHGSTRTRLRHSPSGRRAVLVLVARTPSSLISQYSKPAPASICPERIASRARVLRDHRLGAGPARGSSDAQDVPHRFLAMHPPQAMPRAPRDWRAPPRRAARAPLYGCLCHDPVAGRGRGELERAHAALSDVAKALHRVEALRRSALTLRATRRSTYCRSRSGSESARRPGSPRKLSWLRAGNVWRAERAAAS